MWYWWVFRLWNCKSRKILVDKLVAEYTEDSDEVKIAEITSTKLHSAEHENVRVWSYKIYSILAVIALAMSIGVGAYFAYSCLYLKRDVTLIKFGACTQWNWMQFHWTYKWEK